MSKIFIGNAVQKSIENQDEWSKSWDTVLELYNTLDGKSFYLSLSFTFLSILEIGHPTIPNFYLNTVESRKTYSDLQHENAFLLSYYLELVIFVIKRSKSTPEERIELYKQTNDVLEKKKSFFNILKTHFPDSTITNILPLNVQEWVKISHVYWLWLHLTAACISINDDNFHNLYGNLLMALFKNIDVFIYCNICKEHFLDMKNSDYFNNIITSNTPIDEKLIVIHDKIRKNQDKPVILVHKEEDFKNDYRQWVKNNI